MAFVNPLWSWTREQLADHLPDSPRQAERIFQEGVQHRAKQGQFEAAPEAGSFGTQLSVAQLEQNFADNEAALNRALQKRELALMTQPELDAISQAAALQGLSIPEFQQVQPQLQAQEQAREEQNAFMTSPAVVNAVNVFKANPQDRTAWEGLANLLATAPVNFIQAGDPTAAQAKFGPQEFLAGDAIVEHFPEIKDDLFAAGERFNPQGGMGSIQNLGPALAIGATALSLGLIPPGTFTGITAAGSPILSGSAAAPFGFAGSTGVGADLALAAGLPSALGPATAAIPNIGFLDQIQNVLGGSQAPPTTTAPVTQTAAPAATSVPATTAAPVAGAAVPGTVVSPTTAAGAATTALGDVGSFFTPEVIQGAGLAANVAGTLIGTQGAQDAASQAAALQASAADRGVAEIGRQFDLTRADFAPFQEAGVSALQQQQALLGGGTPEEQQAAFAAFADTPGQQFLRQQQEKALLRNASRIGGLGGGNIRTALQEQAFGRAQTDFGNQFNRLSALRTGGQTATTNVGQFGQAQASNVARLQGTGAQARASGILGQQQAQSQGIEQLAGFIPQIGQFFQGGIQRAPLTGSAATAGTDFARRF